MVMIETMSIPVESRGFLLKHRDAWSYFHGVKVWFPKNERFGEYQKMYLEGLNSSIKTVMSIVMEVLQEAEDERIAYKERCARRKVESPRVRLVVKADVVPKKTTGSMFSALENLVDDIPESIPVVESEPPKMNAVLQGAWKHGAPVIGGVVKAKIVVVNDVASDCTITGDWGDESDDE